MFRSALIVVAALAFNSPALAASGMRLERDGDFLYARNVGATDLRIVGGRLNHRDDCSLIPSVSTLDGQLFRTLVMPEVRERVLANPALHQSAFEPFVLRPGEALDVAYGSTKCWLDPGSSIIHVQVETDQGGIDLPLQ